MGLGQTSRDFSLNHSDLGFIWIKNFVQIQSDWKSQTEFSLALKNLGLTLMSSDWSTDFGMNWNKHDWFGINFNPKVLSGQY